MLSGDGAAAKGRSKDVRGDVRDDLTPTVCLITQFPSLPEEIRSGLAFPVRIESRSHAKDAIQWVRGRHANAVMFEVRSDGSRASDIEVIRELRRLDASLVLFSFSQSSASSLEKQALEAGSNAHFPVPLDLNELDVVLRTTIENQMAGFRDKEIDEQLLGDSYFQEMLGGSDEMRRVYNAISQVAESRINVIVRGESGTGKELVARAIVALSDRKNKPFISLNCAALPENLIESELFGHERGAYTGAVDSKPGHIELADGGTLFLDEIATLTMPLQTKLLRVLEDHKVQRLGGHQSRKIDFRLICATNEPLEEMTKTGKFREDLYYRIHVVPIFLPPLRKRTGDIALLADHFLRAHAKANRVPPKRLAPEVLTALEGHSWPGNVRELENLMQRLVITITGTVIQLEHLPAHILEQNLTAQEAILIPEGGVGFDHQIRQLEIALLEAAIRREAGNKAAAARLLQLDTQRMKYLCRKYSI
jgi:DNA-binding NtrC family response regulator